MVDLPHHWHENGDPFAWRDRQVEVAENWRQGAIAEADPVELDPALAEVAGEQEVRRPPASAPPALQAAPLRPWPRSPC